MSYMVQYLHLGSWNYHWKRGISWRPWWYLLRKSSLCRKSYTMWGPQTIAKLVNTSPISLWFMAFIAIVAGAYKPTYNWGGSHCRNGSLLFGESAGFILDFPIIVSYDWLVVYLPLWNIWKSVGIMKFPIYGKIKFIFQTTSQCMNQFSHGMLRCLLAHRKLAMSSHRVQVILFPRGTLCIYISSGYLT